MQNISYNLQTQPNRIHAHVLNPRTCGYALCIDRVHDLRLNGWLSIESSTSPESSAN